MLSLILFFRPVFSQTEQILVALSEAKTYTTKSGVAVTCIENKMNDATFCRLFFHPNPAQIESKVQLAKLTGQLLCEGTDTLAPILYKNWVNEKGILISSLENSLITLSSGSNFDSIFLTMMIPLQQPRFDKKLLKKFKQKLIKSQQLRGEPELTAIKAISSVYEKGHFCNGKILGDSINLIYQEDCKRYYNQFMRNSPKHIVVITNAPAKEVFEKAEIYFQNLGKKKSRKFKKIKNLPLQEDAIYFFHKDDKKYIDNCDFATVSLKVGTLNPEKLAITTLGSSTFGHPNTGYFFTELGGSYNLAQNCSSEILACTSTAVWTMQASCKADKLAEAVNAAFEIKKSFLNAPIAEALLKNTGNSLNQEFLNDLLRPNELSIMLDYIWKNKLKQNFFSDYSEKLKFAEPEELTAFMTDNFEKSKMLTVIKGNLDIWFNELLKMTDHADIYTLKNDTIVEIIKKGFGPKRIANSFFNTVNSTEISKKGQIIKAEGTYKSEGKTYPVKMTTYRKKEKFSSELWLYLDSASYFLKPVKVGFTSNGTKFEKIVIDTIKKILIEKKVFDGSRATLETAEGKRELTGADLQEVIALSKPFDAYNYFADSTETEIIGRFTEEGQTFYSVKATMPSGKQQFDYFDAKTKLHIRTEFLSNSSGKEVDKVVFFSDYREVPGTKGVKIPYVKNIITDRREMILNVTETNFKAKIKKNVFVIEDLKEDN